MLSGFKENKTKEEIYSKKEVDQKLEEVADKIIIPTKTSELENDSGYITSEEIPSVPTKTSELENDSGFIKNATLIYTQNFNVDVECSAGGNKEVVAGYIDTPSGYTYIGFLPKTSSNGDGALKYEFCVVGTTVLCKVSSIAGITKTINAQGTALFIKQM